MQFSLSVASFAALCVWNDTKPNPRSPEIVKVIEPETIFAKTGYSAPHTAHCGPDGIYLNALGSVNAIEADPLRGITGDREARWLPDASIAPGGCVVEGRERIIDGRIDTALERVYRRLTYTNA